jgi:hypothetical protein
MACMRLAQHLAGQVGRVRRTQRTVPLADGGPDRPDDYRFTRHAENLSAPLRE